MKKKKYHTDTPSIKIIVFIGQLVNSSIMEEESKKTESFDFQE